MSNRHPAAVGERSTYNLLGKGSITIWRVDLDSGEVDAQCVDLGVHFLRRCDGQWTCSCPFNLDRCIHIGAVRKVVPRPNMVPPKKRRWWFR